MKEVNTRASGVKGKLEKSSDASEVLVFSLAFSGYARFFHHCLKSQTNYCKRFGYQYVLLDRSPGVLTPKQAAWLKIPLLIRALENGYSWVCFIDADCEVRSHTPHLEAVQQENKHIYMAHGFSKRLNSGVIIVQNNTEARSFFRTIFDNIETTIPEEDRSLYENGHVIHFAKQSPIVEVIDQSWNNTASFDRRSYIQHYSGKHLRQIYIERYFSTLDRIAYWTSRQLLRLSPCRQRRSNPSQSFLTSRLEQIETMYPAFASPSNGTQGRNDGLQTRC